MKDKKHDSILIEFANYILHNVNWSESYADKPWFSEEIDKNVDSEELVNLFLNYYYYYENGIKKKYKEVIRCSTLTSINTY